MDDANLDLAQFAGMPAATFLMHREPMLFLDTLVDIGPDFAVCDWQVSADFELHDGRHGVPAYAAIEYMAQCVAVHAGARARARGFVPPQGYLLGTRQFDTSIEHFATGESYTAHCNELIRNADGMGSFACTVRQDDAILASANLAVIEQPRDIPIND